LYRYKQLAQAFIPASGEKIVRIRGIGGEWLQKGRWVSEIAWRILICVDCFGTLALLDLAIYFQHVPFHAVPLLWRVHRVHHTDLDLDLSSGYRFHPFEILLSLLYKVVLVAALGVAPWMMLLFEATLGGTALFTHANLKPPLQLDRFLRRLLVAPDMHRVHCCAVPEQSFVASPRVPKRPICKEIFFQKFASPAESAELPAYQDSRLWRASATPKSAPNQVLKKNRR